MIDVLSKVMPESMKEAQEGDLDIGNAVYYVKTSWYLHYHKSIKYSQKCEEICPTI